MLLVISLIIFMRGVVVMCLRRAHLVRVFLGIEFMALGVFIVMRIAPSVNSLFSLLVLLCMAVSEAAVILSFIVQVTRLVGSDQVNVLRINSV